MCNFFSFGVSKEGKVLAILGEDRKQLIEKGKNPDSHTEIAEFFGLSSEDEMWKFDLNWSYDEFKKFVESEPTVGLVKEMVERAYDGGLPFEDMPLPYLVRAVNFIIENKDAIYQAGTMKFCSDRLAELVFFDLSPDVPAENRLVQLYEPVDEEKVIQLLKLRKGKKGYWRNAKNELVYCRLTNNKNVVFISVSAYWHKWVDENNEVQAERRYNLHLQTFPVKL